MCNMISSTVPVSPPITSHKHHFMNILRKYTKWENKHMQFCWSPFCDLGHVVFMTARKLLKGHFILASRIEKKKSHNEYYQVAS